MRAGVAFSITSSRSSWGRLSEENSDVTDDHWPRANTRGDEEPGRSCSVRTMLAGLERRSSSTRRAFS